MDENYFGLSGSTCRRGVTNSPYHVITTHQSHPQAQMFHEAERFPGVNASWAPACRELLQLSTERVVSLLAVLFSNPAAKGAQGHRWSRESPQRPLSSRLNECLLNLLQAYFISIDKISSGKKEWELIE